MTDDDLTPEERRLTGDGDFLWAAGRSGPVVGIHADVPYHSMISDQVALRTVDATGMATVGGVLDEFARAWDFPDHFGHNKDAFDDCMRDLEPDRAGYLTVVTDANRLLRRDPEQLEWFAESMEFYRDYYRDEADPRAAFAVLLLCPADDIAGVEKRWRDIGYPLARLED